jgi:hypothetical protein
MNTSVRAAYSAWARQGASAGDPYYSENAVRFEPRDEDVLLVPKDVRVGPADCGVSLTSASARADLGVCGIAVSEASAVLAAIDGVRSAAEVRRVSGVRDEAWRAFATKAFGVLLFAPHAVAALEARVSSAEIVRFAGSPYSVVRPYWANMADLAERTTTLDAALGDAGTFLGFLEELHALALVGKDGASFYRPRSPTAEKNTSDPFALWDEPSVTEETPQGTRFVSGPRVNATMLGGAAYQAMLATSLEDVGALFPARETRLPDGLSMGRLVTAKADADTEAAPWFCPPRPLDSRHFELLRAQLAAALEWARAGSASRMKAHLAGFHWAFIRVHPFRFANQSVAMSLVNAVLRVVQRVGTPHLVLDHLALRFGKDAYARAFARGVEAWRTPEPTAAERLFSLMDRKRRAFELLGELDVSNSQQQSILERRAADLSLVFLA